MYRNFKINPYAWSILASASALLAGLVLGGSSGASGTAKPTRSPSELEQQFTSTVKPFMQAYCVACHGKDKPQAQLDLTAYANMAAVGHDFPHWSLILERLDAKQMPPANFGT